MNNIIEWVFSGKGQILLGAMFMVMGLFVLSFGLILILRGFGVIS